MFDSWMIWWSECFFSFFSLMNQYLNESDKVNQLIKADRRNHFYLSVKSYGKIWSFSLQQFQVFSSISNM